MYSLKYLHVYFIQRDGVSLRGGPVRVPRLLHRRRAQPVPGRAGERAGHPPLSQGQRRTQSPGQWQSNDSITWRLGVLEDNMMLAGVAGGTLGSCGHQ